MNIAEEIIISPLKDELIEDINKTNDYFKVFGKVVPSFQYQENGLLKRIYLMKLKKFVSQMINLIGADI
jgi:hypothetical protein